MLVFSVKRISDHISGSLLAPELRFVSIAVAKLPRTMGSLRGVWGLHPQLGVAPLHSALFSSQQQCRIPFGGYSYTFPTDVRA
jgi:hypothetical protein